MAAALAYYTVFSLPGLLFVVITIASFVFDAQNVQAELVQQIQDLLGQKSAQQVDLMLEQATSRTVNATLPALLGTTVLIFAATVSFAQLVTSLNTIWGVKADPERGDIKIFLMKRLLSFGMILGIAFLLLVSLTLSTILNLLGQEIAGILPLGWSQVLIRGLNFFASFCIIAFLFAAIYKVLPDAQIAWIDVFVGSVFTSFLFVIGKELIGYYLGNSPIGSAYGVASSLAVLLVWVYFSAFILLFGAEFTQNWAYLSGRRIVPDSTGVFVDDVEARIPEGENVDRG